MHTLQSMVYKNKKLKLKRTFLLSLRGAMKRRKSRRRKKKFFAFLIQFSEDCCWSLLYVFSWGWCCVCYFIEHIINIISIILWDFLLLKSKVFFVLYFLTFCLWLSFCGFFNFLASDNKP
jgi:hypothetical protein